MSLAILGLGTALPPTVVTRAEAIGLARATCCGSPERASWLSGLYDGSGIETRNLAFDRQVIRDILDGTRKSDSPFLPEGADVSHGPTCGERMRHYAEQAPALAVPAARSALVHSSIPARAVTHLVTVSCTGFHSPGIDVELISALDLPTTVARTNIGFMGCHGAINGLRVAHAFGAVSPGSCILLCAVELCALHYHYRWDPQQMVANALFADGAAALVGVPQRQAAAGTWRVAATGSYLFPNSQHAMSWRMGDHHFEMTLSKRVPDLIARTLRHWLADWLGQQGLDLGEIASWAVHPGGPRILAAVEESLGLDSHALDESKGVLARCGNMSSPTLLFILDRLRARHAPRPCLALGFGPGLVAEAALFR
jgi:predicted naringenin-chalcone synthase